MDYVKGFTTLLFVLLQGQLTRAYYYCYYDHKLSYCYYYIYSPSHLLVSGIVGGIFFVIVCISMVCCCCYKRRANNARLVYRQNNVNVVSGTVDQMNLYTAGYMVGVDNPGLNVYHSQEFYKCPPPYSEVAVDTQQQENQNEAPPPPYDSVGNSVDGV